MDCEHRQIIKDNRELLEKSIDLNKIKDSLEQSKIFTISMLYDIYEENTSLFEELHTRGPHAFEKFIKLLVDADYYYLAAKLDRCIISSCSEPDQYQNGSLRDPSELQLIEFKNGSIVPEEDLHSNGNIESGTFYLISPERPGYCLIINCDNNCGLCEEQESILTVEATALDIIFKSFGYIPVWRSNAENSLLETIEKLSKENFDHADSCVIIIIGQGGKLVNSNIVYDKNRKPIFVNEILNLFSDSRCQSLCNKPKIIILPSGDTLSTENDFHLFKNIELHSDINDVFLLYLPPVCMYAQVPKSCRSDTFGEILKKGVLQKQKNCDFKAVVQLSLNDFTKQYGKYCQTEKINLFGYQTIGHVSKKIIFNRKA